MKDKYNKPWKPDASPNEIVILYALLGPRKVTQCPNLVIMLRIQFFWMGKKRAHVNHLHYNDVMMSPMASPTESPASRLFTQPLFKRRSKKISKLRVTGLCEGNSPVTGEFPTQRASNAEKSFHVMTSLWRMSGRGIASWSAPCSWTVAMIIIIGTDWIWRFQIHWCKTGTRLSAIIMLTRLRLNV